MYNWGICQEEKSSTVKERRCSILSGDYAGFTAGNCQLGLMPNAKATMKIHQNRDEALKKKSKDLARVLQYLINIIWSELFDWLWRQSQRHLESRLQTESARLLQAPFSPPFQSLFFTSTPSLNSPSPRCPCPTAAPCSLMSGCVDALGWWAIVQNDGNYDGPSPSLALILLYNKLCKAKKGSFQQSLSRRCLQISLNAEAIGVATVTWAWQGRRGEDALLKFKTQHQNWDRKGIEVTANVGQLLVWDGLVCRDFHSQPSLGFTDSGLEIYRNIQKKMCTYRSVKSK